MKIHVHAFLLLRGITVLIILMGTRFNNHCAFYYRGRITQIQSLFYAFRGIEAHENQFFRHSRRTGGTKIIQSPPERV